MRSMIAEGAIVTERESGQDEREAKGKSLSNQREKQSEKKGGEKTSREEKRKRGSWSNQKAKVGERKSKGQKGNNR